MSYPRSRLSPASVEAGRVLDVDVATYSLTVTTQFSKKPMSGISFATPYQHFANGEGIYFMPEVGSVCWICFPSDGMRPFVLGWASGSNEGDYRANKKDLNPGDIFLGTRDDNFCVLRRGGVVQIGAGPLSQRIYLPIGNTIRDIAENYHLQTLAGELEWAIARTEETTDGRRPAGVKLRAREFADDAKPIAELEIGSHGENEPTILSLNIRASGADNSNRSIVLAIEKSGNVTWTVKKDSIWKVTGDGQFVVDVKGAVTLTSKEAAGIQGNTFTAHGKQSAEVASTSGKLDLKGATGVEVEGPKVTVNGGTFPVLVMSPSFQMWLAKMAVHVHTGAAGPVGPPQDPSFLPIPPPDAAHISKTLFAK